LVALFDLVRVLGNIHRVGLLVDVRSLVGDLFVFDVVFLVNKKLKVDWVSTKNNWSHYSSDYDAPHSDGCLGVS